MKVIFLDIDGVLNVIPQGHDEYGAIFHPHFVENLKRLLDSTNAKIVISSSWRSSGLETMQNMWKKRGLPGEIIDVTPHLFYGLDPTKIDKWIMRGMEIQVWLERREDIERYVIIDDDDDMLEIQMPNLVYCSKNFNHSDFIDAGYGLTKECTERAIQILN